MNLLEQDPTEANRCCSDSTPPVIEGHISPAILQPCSHVLKVIFKDLQGQKQLK
uniref:Uncharacterized protein n=1 Tax=Anguilla anguilla TaxID=7936 RepID=A0A0E9RD42_ANGAN